MNEEQAKQPVAIIGYGTAGVNVAIALRNAGYKGAIRAFSDTDIMPYSPILTSYFAGGRKELGECFPWSEEELAELNVEWLPNHPVTSLDPAAHEIVAGGETFEYSKCVICTGARPATFGFPKVEGGEYAPLVLRTMDDAKRMKGVLEDPSCRRILVSGASMVALKMFEACLNQGKVCTEVGMNPHLLDMTALPETAQRFEKGILAQGVELRLSQTMAAVKVVPKEVEADEGSSRDWQLQVTFSNGDVDFFDEIAVAHGVRSDFSFIKEGSLNIDRGIVVDEHMRTSDPDVYAAGDVAQALELVSGEKRIVGIWKTAAVQGACAGAAIAAEMAGGEPSAATAYQGAIATNTISVNGILFISAGSVVLGPNCRMELREKDDMTVAYVYETADDGSERLIGFNLACDTDEEGSVAYDTGAMLTMRIENACRR